jgi:hypothetical protein
MTSAARPGMGRQSDKSKPIMLSRLMAVEDWGKLVHLGYYLKVTGVTVNQRPE